MTFRFPFQDKIAEIAEHLEGHVRTTHHHWARWVDLPDGLLLRFEPGRSTNRLTIHALLPCPNYLQISVEQEAFLGRITISATRASDRAAKDIERRLLNPARRWAADLRAKYAVLERKNVDSQSVQDAVIEKLSGFSELVMQAENADRIDRKLACQYDNSSSGALFDFRISGQGKINVRRIQLSDDPGEALTQLEGILLVLGARSSAHRQLTILQRLTRQAT